jgi:hypothetical protein
MKIGGYAPPKTDLRPDAIFSLFLFDILPVGA